MGGEFWYWVWETYKANREHIIPIVTLIGGGIAAWVALGQLRTAMRQAEITRLRHEEQTKAERDQAEIAMRRHEAQTDADLQRRITESFTKAVEQLGSDKLQVRLGGIYTLERISRESEFDYWPIMETLTGFVRERARWKNQPEASQKPDHRPPTDVEAVLTVIKRRNANSRKHEQSQEWTLDLSSSDLRGASLEEAHLEGANLSSAKGHSQDQLDQAFGNAETKLPEGLARPAHWPQ
jgi:uncharacterized protein YjbI with pentapeptide repeats